MLLFLLLIRTFNDEYAIIVVLSGRKWLKVGDDYVHG